MFKKIKQALAVVGLKPIPKATDFLANNSVQEDPKQQEMIKRLNKHLDEQMSLINTRALRPHDPSCEDPVMCTQDPCWIWEPDKIVGEPYIITRSNDE